MAQFERFDANYVYMFNADDEYFFAVPEEYAHGSSLGDCYIVNEKGEHKPGYEFPVPMRISDMHIRMKKEEMRW